MKISDNTVLVTGATRGLGLAIARRFIDLGNDVIVVGRTRDSAGRAARDLGALAGYGCSLDDAHALDALATTVITRHPALNVLVNNAGVQYALDVMGDAIPYPRIRGEIAVNLTAPVTLTSLLLPTLASRPEAAVVNVTSALGFLPRREAPVYGATKAGLHSWSLALRAQLGGTRVRVVELVPPMVDTDMARGRSGRKMDPELVAAALTRGLARDRAEVTVGLARWARLIARCRPSKVLNR